jgi:outer membrane protein assembly factor BamB
MLPIRPGEPKKSFSIPLMLLAGVLWALSGSHPQAIADDSLTGNALKAPLAVDWKYTGQAYSNNPTGPVVADSTIYYASGTRLYALDEHTGAQKWVYPEGSYLPNPIMATPTISDGTLFVPEGDGLYALDADTGRQKYPAYKVRGGVISHPAVWGDSVYFISGSERLYGIKASNGHPLNPLLGGGIPLPGALEGDVALYNGMLYFCTSNGEIHAVDAQSGAQKWHSPVLGVTAFSTPAVSQNYTYVVGQSAVTCLRTDNGLVVWSLPARNDFTAPAATDSDGNVYLCAANLKVYALTPQRKPLWKNIPEVDFPVSAAPIVSGNLLIVCSAEAGVYAYDRNTGELVWDYSIQPSSLDPNKVPQENHVLATPAVDNGHLFVVSDDGSVTCFSNGAVDLIPPIITPLAPERGEYCKGEPPFIVRAHIFDFGSGLKPSSVTLSIDDHPINQVTREDLINGKDGFTFDKDKGILEYDIQPKTTGVSNAFSDGHHTITITAQDWKGNQKTETWLFTTGDSYPIERAQRAQNTQGTNTAGGRSGRPGIGGSGGGNGGGN